jgi:hypothetical protein
MRILLWILSRCVLAVLVFALTFVIEMRFETRIVSVTGFATLVTLVCAGIGLCFDGVVDRLLFGRQVTGKLPLWIKILLGIGLSLGLAIAIWDGIEARQNESPPTYVEPASVQMFKNIKVPTPEEIDHLRQLSQQRSPASQQ